MKLFCMAVLLLLTASFCFGQAPSVALSTSSSDVYVGYIYTNPDDGTFDALPLNGAEVAYTKNFGAHWAVIASGTGVFGNFYQVKEFSGTVGPKFNFLTGRFRPYATAQVGFAYQISNGMYAGDHHPPLKNKKDEIEDGLTYRGGLGVDLQLSSRVYWRVLQWDVQPQPWARHTPFYTNFSSGVGLRF
jgi:hypothetical protein